MALGFQQMTRCCQVSADTKNEGKTFLSIFHFRVAANKGKFVVSQAKTQFTEFYMDPWMCAIYKTRAEQKGSKSSAGVADFDFNKWERGCECT